MKPASLVLSLVVSALFSISSFAADVSKTVSFPNGATEAQILAKGIEVAREWIKKNPTVKPAYEQRLQAIHQDYPRHNVVQKPLRGIVTENMQSSDNRNNLNTSGSIIVMSPITLLGVGSGNYSGHMLNILLNVSFDTEWSDEDGTFKKMTYRFSGFSKIVSDSNGAE